jgi:hypothetical protein
VWYPIPAYAQNFDIVAVKKNLYMSSSFLMGDFSPLKIIVNDIYITFNDQYAVPGPASASLDDIDFSIFTNDAVIEFHGCNTAGHPDYGNWNDTSVWLYKFDNIAYWASIALYQAGKKKAVAIGHYAGSTSGDATWVTNDFRTEKRVIYHNGQILGTDKTEIKGDLWATIKSFLK